jgi:hypothetical protein
MLLPLKAMLLLVSMLEAPSALTEGGATAPAFSRRMPRKRALTAVRLPLAYSSTSALSSSEVTTCKS